MKTGFFGTPEIAAYYFERIMEENEVIFAVTGEDKPKGRHGSPVFCAVKEIAVAKGVPVYQPANLNDEYFLTEIAEKKADIFIVVAYGKIIPSRIFNMPKFHTVNLHPSLLPKYRGAAPVQWVLINGEPETGVTIQYINERLDAGDILAQKKIPLTTDMTAADLYNLVLPSGYDLLNKSLRQISAGELNPIKQNDDESSYCGKIDRETAHINWTGSALNIHNLVRGLNPKPVAWTEFKEKNIKIYKTKLLDDIDIKLAPGALGIIKKKLAVGTGCGCLEIIELQPESKKIMDGLSFINGYRIGKEDAFKNS